MVLQLQLQQLQRWRWGLFFFNGRQGLPPASGEPTANPRAKGAARLTQARGAAAPVARWGDQTEVLFGRVVTTLPSSPASFRRWWRRAA
jgi:hypothetical protein